MTKTRRRVLRATLCLLCAGLVWCLVLAGIVWRFGEGGHAVKSDCIIVLGAAVRGNVPSPVFE